MSLPLRNRPIGPGPQSDPELRTDEDRIRTDQTGPLTSLGTGDPKSQFIFLMSKKHKYMHYDYEYKLSYSYSNYKA
uniref:Uncharacterized protein n=1 Tax=Rhizophagus irregularis (strain DAOM 181602 / DAOM 197198 / MUCL 43194) TaxID=747089 RepID=U9V8Q7_RHIID